MSAADWVTLASLLAGIICFVLYCWATVSALLVKSAVSDAAGQAKSVVDPDAKSVSIGDFTKLLEALGGLTDSLSKAGPSLTSLIGAILMFAIAAVASGALHSSPVDAGRKPVQSSPSPSPTTAAANSNTTS